MITFGNMIVIRIIIKIFLSSFTLVGYDIFRVCLVGSFENILTSNILVKNFMLVKM